MPTLSSVPEEIKITELQKVLHKFLSSAWRQQQHTKTNIPSYGLLLVECMDELQPLINQQIKGVLDELEGEATHHIRECLTCGNLWEGLHCPHDGYQNPCPACGYKPTPLDNECSCETALPLSTIQKIRSRYED